MKKAILAMGFLYLISCTKTESPVSQKQLTVNVTPEVGGSVTPSSGAYKMGSSVNLMATPSPEYIFKEWTGGFTGTTNPARVVMDADKTVTAVFEKREYPLSLTIVGSGTVKEEIIKIASTATNYKSGTTVRLTPQPSAGFQFKKWSGDDTTNKSPLDLVVSKAINLTCTFEKMVITSLKIDNLLDTLIVSKKHKYVVKGVYSNGTTIDLSDSVKITASNSGVSLLTDKNMIGLKPGNIKIQVSYNNLTTEDEFLVSNIEILKVDSRLKSTNKGVITVPVLIVNYLPTADGIYLDKDRTLQPMIAWDEAHKYTLERAKNKILTDKIIEKNEIEEGTRYHDYSTNKIQPYVNIDVVGYINVYDVKYISVGTRLVDTTTNDNDDKINNPVLINWYNIDFNDLFNTIDLKNYVNNLNVKEVWVTTFPKEGGALSYNVAESNMSPGLTNSNGLDVSNGGGGLTDLPRYNNTYVVYGDNGFRGVDTDLHNRGHQLEAQLTYIDNKEPTTNRILWTKAFVPRDSAGTYVKSYRLGNTHWCPNSTSGYDYWNKTSVLSDIETWKPSGGTFVNVNVDTWLGKKYAFESTVNMISASAFSTGEVNYSNDAQSKWFIYWWQSIPGYNNTLKDNDMSFTNWWDIFYNWDDNIKKGTRLIK